MRRVARDRDLKTSFKFCFDQARGNVKTLERIFVTFDSKSGFSSNGMLGGFADELESKTSVFQSAAEIDSALICVSQKVLSHQIAMYNWLVCWASAMGFYAESRMLSKILDQKEVSARELSAIAHDICQQISQIAAA